MSRGRTALPLGDWQNMLQAAFAAGQLDQAVAMAVGRKPTRKIGPEELSRAANVADGSHGMMRPADAQFRLTRQEFRAEVRRMVKTRRREWAEVVDMVLSDQEPPEGFYVKPEIVAGIQILAAQCARELRGEMAPERPKRTRKPKPMRPRTEGQCSAVVIHSPRSGYRDSAGKPLNAFEAATALSISDPYLRPVRTEEG